MKKIIFILLLLTIYQAGLTQQKYDDGPITGGNFVVSGTWGRNNISFSFLNGTTDIANDDERNAVRQAFQLWADYANLNFTEVASNGDIQVSWQIGNHGDGNPFDGINGVLAHAFFPPPAGGTTSFAGDVHFDDAETWSMLERPVPSGQPMDLVTVAAHEIGHALGLGHSNITCALMNAFYNGSHRYLAQDDIDGIRSIYGRRDAMITNSTTALCNSATYFFRNIPTGATINWVSADNSIATINNQGLVTRVGNANRTVRITGTITLPCGFNVVEFRDIYVGPIPLSSYSVAGAATVYASAGYSYSLTYPYYIATPANIFWRLPSGWTIVNGQGTPYINVWTGNTGGAVQVDFKNCGQATGIYKTVVIGSGGPPPQRVTNTPTFQMSPNPSTGQFAVTLITESKTSTIKEILIKNKMGVPIYQQKFSTNQKTQSINLSNQPIDIYTVQIFDGIQWSTQRLSLIK